MKRSTAAVAACCLTAAATCQVPADGSTAQQKVGSSSRSCRAEVPADLTTAPAQWLGGCVKGLADGFGVMRTGNAAAHEFFAGRMHQGRLVDGVLVLKSGLMMVAIRFDAQRRVVVSDGLRPSEEEAVFRTATAGAEAVSQRFKTAGNQGSATYYANLAKRIRNAPPE